MAMQRASEQWHVHGVLAYCRFAIVGLVLTAGAHFVALFCVFDQSTNDARPGMVQLAETRPPWRVRLCSATHDPAGDTGIAMSSVCE